jgi:nitroreductase
LKGRQVCSSDQDIKYSKILNAVKPGLKPVLYSYKRRSNFMSLLDISNKRYSVRSYEDKEVEREKLMQVLEAARIAPSAVNYQPVHFIVVTEKNGRQKLFEAYPRPWLKEAPVIIVVCGDHRISWKRKDGKDHCDIDAAITVDHMTLAATELGLGTCWICAFDAQKCHDLLELPDYLEPIVLMPLGYPKGNGPVQRVRKNIDEIVSWEKYQPR